MKKERKKEVKNGIQLEFDFDEKTNSELLNEYNELKRKENELKLSLLEITKHKVGEEIEFLDSNDALKKGRVMSVSIGDRYVVEPYYDYEIKLFRENGQLGKRTAYFSESIKNNMNDKLKIKL